MKLSDRQKNLLALLAKHQRMSVAKLAGALHVSEMTVRRDLSAMEKSGLLRRYHGGALAIDENFEQPIVVRSVSMDQEKKRLAQQAARYLSEDSCIFLDSSSTSSYLIPFIAALRRVTVITNSVRTLMLLSRSHIPCILLGGRYYENDMCLVGDMTEEVADMVNVDVAFFSCLGLSDEGLVTDIDEPQTFVRRRVMKRSALNVFLFDSSKRGRVYPYTVCGPDSGAVIIAD